MFNDDEFDSMFDEKNPIPDANISHWDFRLFRGSDGYFSIGEVYYDHDGNPVAWTEAGISPGGEDVEEVILCLNKMLDSIKKPVFIPPKED